MKRFFDLVTSPSFTVYSMSRSDMDFKGVYVFVVAGISSLASIFLITGIPSWIASFMVTWGVFIRLAAGFLFLLSLSALYHFFADMFGGSGESLKTLKGMFYITAPFTFLTPAALIANLWGGRILFVLFLLAAVVFFIILQYELIKYFYGLPPDRSLKVLALPWVIFSAAGLFSFVFLNIGLVAYFL
ncbi:MAG: YIP1 family protein [Elusimicrobiota bacterium]